MTKFAQTPDGQIVIIGKPPSAELMAEITDRMGETEGAVIVDAKELEAFLLGLEEAK